MILINFASRDCKQLKTRVAINCGFIFRNVLTFAKIVDWFLFSFLFFPFVIYIQKILSIHDEEKNDGKEEKLNRGWRRPIRGLLVGGSLVLRIE